MQKGVTPAAGLGVAPVLRYDGDGGLNDADHSYDDVW